jgi:hypothetical protein
MGPSYRVLLDRIRGHGSFGQRQCGGFVTESHINESHIFDEHVISRLFFEERFQFTVRLSPTFLRCGMIAGDFLRPA